MGSHHTQSWDPSHLSLKDRPWFIFLQTTVTMPGGKGESHDGWVPLLELGPMGTSGNLVSLMLTGRSEPHVTDGQTEVQIRGCSCLKQFHVRARI